jgi:tRNA (guanine-N7-)-methyltransferase
VPQDQWTHTAIKHLPDRGPLDWEEIFGRTAPIVVELGCGNGRYTLLSAVSRPDHDHFAIDTWPAAIRYATRRANQRGLSNVRFAAKDAQTFMAHYVPESSVAEVHLYHPQPYHDPTWARHRLVTPRFLANVHRGLASGGLFVIQTDSPEYWSYMKTVLPAFFVLEEQQGRWPDAPEGRSRREILVESRGLPIFRGIAQRRDELTHAEARAVAARLPGPTFRTKKPKLKHESRGGRRRDAAGSQRRRNVQPEHSGPKPLILGNRPTDEMLGLDLDTSGFPESAE